MAANTSQQESPLSMASRLTPHMTLESVRIQSGSFHLSSDNEAAAESRVKAKVRYSIDGSSLTSTVALSISAEPPLGHKELAVFRCNFKLKYQLAESAQPSDRELECFAKINGIYNAWPFWREFVQSATGRMDIPRLTLPLLRVYEAIKLAGLADEPPTSAEAGKATED